MGEQTIKLGTHRLRQSWVQKRFDNLDDNLFPKPLPEDKLPESQLDCTYNVEPGDLNEPATWKFMAESGEMSLDALRECVQFPFMDYDVNNLPDFEGLEEANTPSSGPSESALRLEWTST